MRNTKERNDESTKRRSAPDKALIAVTMDMEMSRHYPQWEITHWDYEKGNLDQATKDYTSEVCRRVKAAGGVVHMFVLGRTLEQVNVDWLQALVREGHVLGNHTYDHVKLVARTPETIQFRFRLAPWLIEQMGNPELARPAGEAFASITGVDVAYEDLEGEWPEGFEAGPTEAPEDENVEMDPDEDLPWPASPLIQGWWSKNQGRFSSGQRHLLGRPITPETLGEVLRTGMQRQRAAAALELALCQPGQPLFEVRARGDMQQELLGS